MRQRYKLQRPWKCFCCSSKRALHLHHITYERIKAELLDDLVPVCQEHHKQIHRLVNDGSATLANAHFLVKEGKLVVLPDGPKTKKKKEKPTKGYKPKKISFGNEKESVRCIMCLKIYPPRHPSLTCDCGGYLRLISSSPENRTNKLEAKFQKRERERELRRQLREQSHLRPHLRSKAS